ncbi:hypothetical protein PPL_09419 [Heterostelium album PN500]|uniref:BCAS3 WD40 domain-containing protein n=1 Tax=Heterostelium pallidum (strain ATCC 26659 / Pp 5 / PN500) TaxID=670386 RepID=D3BPF1_HETP5|nr:hypothetical protein PPL_09419 [Heterostelium album PN500]EFA76669.1 hypothetical protein PPL_09419 [Heterostelium album PN500]|eukprot:XP_020428801.1 hypothetical protein PPL_09419 [Heterostelium album PN500]
MMYNLSYGGAKAEEKPSPYSQSALSGYLQGISSYIPSSIKSTIKKQIYTSPSITEGEKDTIVSTYFDECEILGKKHKLLNICYNNGFQIWDLDNPDGVKELFSLREGMIRFVKVLKTPAEKEPPNSIYYGKRPLLAVVSGEDNSKVTRNMVRIFSLKTCELFNMSKFQTPVYNVISNEKIFLVVLKERIVGFNPVTMAKVLSLSTFPSAANSFGVVALGPRWLAYTDSAGGAGHMSTSPNSSSLASVGPYIQHLKSYQQHNQNFSDTAVDVATDLAKEVAQKLYYFGDIGRKKVSSYLYPEDSPSSHVSANPHQEYIQENNCVIVIYDFIKQRQVAVIKPPHPQPVSYLNFDPSGTLLFTSSTEGTKLNVYQIMPFTNSLSVNPQSNPDPSHAFRHIYVLKRGITNASIQGLSINDTSKWAALTTSRGTTHIYAINPLGGDVNIHSHIVKSSKTKPRDYMSEIPNAHPSLMTLSAMDRIKLGNTKDESNQSTQLKVPSNITAGNSCFLETTNQDLEKLFVVNQNGQLILYELRPHPPTTLEVDPNTLCMSLNPIHEWDVCRKTRSSEFKSTTIPYNEKNNEEIVQDSEARWLFNVEITTHSQEIRPIWGNTQFSFRNSSYKPSPDSLSFFDEDYPIGEVIKIEKKKSNISSPRSESDDIEIVNLSDIKKNEELEMESEMELMKQLDQAIKTPLSSGAPLYPQLTNSNVSDSSPYMGMGGVGGGMTNGVSMNGYHNGSPTNPIGIPKPISANYNDIYSQSPDTPIYPMKPPFTYDDYSYEPAKLNNDLLPLPKSSGSSVTSTTTTTTTTTNANGNSNNSYPPIPTTMPPTYKKTLDLDDPLPVISSSPSIPIPKKQQQQQQQQLSDNDLSSSTTSSNSSASASSTNAATSPTSPNSKTLFTNNSKSKKSGKK